MLVPSERLGYSGLLRGTTGESEQIKAGFLFAGVDRQASNAQTLHGREEWSSTDEQTWDFVMTVRGMQRQFGRFDVCFGGQPLLNRDADHEQVSGGGWWKAEESATEPLQLL